MRHPHDPRRHDDDPYQGHRDDRQRDLARQFGARDGEGGSWGERRYPEPRVFDADHDFHRFDPGAARSQWERSWFAGPRVFDGSRHESDSGPRYERDEGFDRDRDNHRFAADTGRFDRATSQSRPDSFVDAYRRDEARGHFGGVSQRGFGGPGGRAERMEGAFRASRPFDDMPRDRGFEDQAIYRNREYSHHPAGVDDRRGEPWGRWRGDPSQHAASTHPSPYTPNIGPRVDHRGRERTPHPEDERGWSGQRMEQSGELGGAFRSPAWEIPHEREASRAWGERPHLGKGPRGYVRSDERVREEVCDCLSDGYVDASRVEVDVKAGVVTLSGQAPDKASKRKIEDIAERCRGVQSVDNQIRVQRVTAGASYSPTGKEPSAGKEPMLDKEAAGKETSNGADERLRSSQKSFS